MYRVDSVLVLDEDHTLELEVGVGLGHSRTSVTHRHALEK